MIRLEYVDTNVTYLNSGPQNGYSGTRTRICAVLPLHYPPIESTRLLVVPLKRAKT
jgi:hypothetical protein